MKLVIKVKEITPDCAPTIYKVGDWLDLRAAQTVKLECPQATILKKNGDSKQRRVVFNSTLIPLGVAIKLPKGFEAVVVPRSSTFGKYCIMQSNSMGVIDNSYSGNDDEWKMPVVAFGNMTINKGTRIAQFRIQPSQKATWWQKLKWLFSSGIKVVKVKDLNGPSRGGFGSTGD